MADATLQIGNGNWAVKPSLLLGYNVGVNGYNPIEMAVSRETSGSRTNSLGIIDYKDSNIARINYQNGIGSLLLEPQRTNLSLNTVWAGGGSAPTSWTKQLTGNTSPIASIKNPNVTAYNFNGVAIRGFFSQSQTLTINTTYAFSIYVESVNIANSVGNMLLIANGTGTSAYLKNNVSILSAENIAAGNTYTLIFSATATTTISEIRVGLGAGGGTPTGDFTLSMPQLEVGSYSTSYIPTIASTVTRNADVISRNNIYTNGYITSAGGTWFVELNNNLSLISDATSAGLFLETSTNGFSNGFSVRGASSGRLRIYKNLTPSFTAIYITTTDTVKIAIKWNGATADVFANGIKVVSATPFTFTNMEFLNLQGKDVPKYIKSTALYSTPISDAECIALTTL